jgi:hypothetical protein
MPYHRNTLTGRRQGGGAFSVLGDIGTKIGWHRVSYDSIQEFMGKSKRNHVTGEVLLRRCDDLSDFLLVDLYKRKTPPEEMSRLVQDNYIYRPVLMKYRTWMYHYFSHSEKVLAGGENAMLSHVLAQWCIDAPTHAGRYSPIVCFVPLTVATCLTGQFFLVALALSVMSLIHMVNHITNTPSMYRYSRIATLIPRIAFIVYALAQFQTDTMLGLVGSIVVIACAFVDVALGDLGSFFNYKLHCKHVIVKIPTNSRLMICERFGAHHQEEIFGSRGHVEEEISGFANWKHTNSLIADIHGLVVELRPLEVEDWLKVRDQFYKSQTPLPYICLDVFGDDTATDESETYSPIETHENLRLGSKQSSLLSEDAIAKKKSAQHVNVSLIVEDY